MSAVHRFLGNVNVARELQRTKALSLIAVAIEWRGNNWPHLHCYVFTLREVIFGSFVVLRACVITN